MARTVKHSKLDSRAARSRLKRGRQPHWQDIVTGPNRAHLGYQRFKGDAQGRWILRRFLGDDKYRIVALGKADDAALANGSTILNFEQATAKARLLVDAPRVATRHITVRQALESYSDHKRTLGQSVSDIESRGRAHILPPLGDLIVSELTAERLRRWLATLAASPAQLRPKAGKPQYRPEPADDDGVRQRRASANRVLTMLKAMLNHAFDEGHVANRDAWGRKLKPFRDVETARVRYLSVAEAQRLINACDQDFRPLVRAALETGCRYSELTRLQVHDFNKDGGTLSIGKSKSGKARHVILTEQGSVFFRTHCLGREGSALMFAKSNGSAWQKSEQKRPIDAACVAARIKPRITFHGLRHTWASLATMAGVPLMIVARNLGHTDTRMVERFYAHLAPSHVRDAILRGAPRFDIEPEKKVVPLQ
jgi:integrase